MKRVAETPLNLAHNIRFPKERWIALSKNLQGFGIEGSLVSRALDIVCNGVTTKFATPPPIYPHRDKYGKCARTDILAAHKCLDLVDKGRASGPFHKGHGKVLVWNGKSYVELGFAEFFGIGKGNGEIRGIHNLSKGQDGGLSINECIADEYPFMFSIRNLLEYVSFFRALGKKDFKSGFCQIPLSYADLQTSGISIMGLRFGNQCASMGRKNSPMAFQLVEYLFERILADQRPDLWTFEVYK